MKHFVIGVVSGLLAIAMTASAVGPLRPEPQTPAEFEAAIGELEHNFLEKIERVDTAVREGERQGVINVTTEAYYLGLLFKISAAFLHQQARDWTYPPLFDTSPEMQPVNVAWEELRSEETSQMTRRAALAHQMDAVAMEALRRVLRKGEKTQDLDVAERFLQAANVLELTVRTVGFGGSNTPLPGSAGALFDPLNEALIARRTNDAARLGRALQGLKLKHEAPGGMPPFRPANTSVIDPAVDEFIDRIVAEYRERMKSAQGELEKALMERRPAGELDVSFAHFLTRLTDLRKVEDGANSAPTFRNSSRPPNIEAVRRLALTDGYSEVLSIYYEVFTRLTTGRKATAATPATALEGLELRGEEEFAQGEAFRVFLLNLRSEGEGAVPASAPSAPGTEPPRVEALKANETAASVVEWFRGIAPAIHTPVEVADRAQEVQQKITTLRQEPADRGSLALLTAMEEELRQLAAEWQAGAVGPSAGQSTRGASLPPELIALRERAFREQMARQLALPELLRKPGLDLPLSQGLVQAATEAGQSGHWKRALEILRGGKFPQEGPQAAAQAISAYLAGQQFEEAELYSRAIKNYREVVGQTAVPTPIAESVARLKVLRADHPDLFQNQN